MTPALRFTAVSLAQGGRTILRDLTFAVPQGAFVGVFGPNGAGKTTLLRAALGLLAPAHGKIEVLGQPAARGRGRVGYMPQASAGLADLALCGRDFVAAAAGGAGWGVPSLGPARRAEVARVLALTDAAATAHRPVRSLSGGERQRLMLAQALLGQPDLLLLDEPLAGLDPPHQADAVALIARLQRRLGITVLFCAHELDRLVGTVDLVLCLGGGQAALGTVDAVVNGPALSALYGAPVDVVRAQGHLFVVAAAGQGGDARV